MVATRKTEAEANVQRSMAEGKGGRRALGIGRAIRYGESVSTKEVLLEVAEKLPADATLVDAIYELEFRQAIEDGLASLDQGKRVSLEEARQRIPLWTAKSSSRSKP